MKSIYDPQYITLVGRLRKRRLELGIRQSDVAAQLGHTNRWLSKVERLDIRLDVLKFIRICRALGLSAHRMVRRVEEELAGEDDPPLAIRATGAVHLVDHITRARAWSCADKSDSSAKPCRRLYPFDVSLSTLQMPLTGLATNCHFLTMDGRRWGCW